MSRPRRSLGNQPGRLVATMLRALAAELSDPGRYARAKAYARDGAVIEIDIRPGVVAGLVLGSRRDPYEVLLVADPAPADEIAAADPATLGYDDDAHPRTATSWPCRARAPTPAAAGCCASTPSPCCSCSPTRRASSRSCSCAGERAQAREPECRSVSPACLGGGRAVGGPVARVDVLAGLLDSPGAASGAAARVGVAPETPPTAVLDDRPAD